MSFYALVPSEYLKIQLPVSLLDLTRVSWNRPAAGNGHCCLGLRCKQQQVLDQIKAGPVVLSPSHLRPLGRNGAWVGHGHLQIIQDKPYAFDLLKAQPTVLFGFLTLLKPEVGY